MKKVITVILVFASFQFSFSQMFDNIWLMGHGDVNFSPVAGESIWDFRTDPPTITKDTLITVFKGTNASFCDSSGNLLMYTNGMHIADSTHQIMENGDNLNPGYVRDNWEASGAYPFSHAAFFLPAPGNPSLVYLIHMKVDLDSNFGLSGSLLYALIDKTKNNGKGEVIEKNVLVHPQPINKGIATKHGNGRNWWIVVPYKAEKKFQIFLLGPNGIKLYASQDFPDLVGNNYSEGQTAFSPDGSKYAYFDNHNALHFFDFDRCSGHLSNYKAISFSSPVTSGSGVAFSPNGRFAYFSSNIEVYQVDMWNDNFPSSVDTVAVYDINDPNAKTFRYGQIAPNGKLYFNAASTSQLIHVIHKPNLKGDSCRFEKQGLELPTISTTSLPTFPNYRLGPLDGSPCDTLGIDNLPKANFRYDQDTTLPWVFEFTDLSYYEPETWEWDFGDNTSSTEINPVHAFPKPGIYNVCLTVSNDNGSHTSCKDIEVLITAAKEQQVESKPVAVFPNPASHWITISNDGSFQRSHFALFDNLGRQVKREKIMAGESQKIVDVSGIPEGFYYWNVVGGNEILGSGKLVIKR